MPSIAVIINQSAGSKPAIDPAEVADSVRASGMEPSITVARDGSEITAAAKRARSSGTEIVVAGGGDGTISSVAAVLIGTEIALGVLPLGTLNHFAKALAIPLDPKLAVQTIVTGHRMKVDVGEVNGKIFLNNSSVGLYPEIVHERDAQQRRFGRSKWVAFFWATLRSMHRHPFVDVRLEVDGKRLIRRTPFVFIGNNEYAIEGFELGQRQSLTDGRLSLYVSQRTGRLALLALAPRALFGRLRQARDFDALRATEVVIETRKPRVKVATDGEVTLMNAPLEYRILARALTVIVPPSAPAQR